jgi:hypothetical protein
VSTSIAVPLTHHYTISLKTLLLAFLVVLVAVTAAAADKGWLFFKALLTT